MSVQDTMMRQAGVLVRPILKPREASRNARSLTRTYPVLRQQRSRNVQSVRAAAESVPEECIPLVRLKAALSAASIARYACVQMLCWSSVLIPDLLNVSRGMIALGYRQSSHAAAAATACCLSPQTALHICSVFIAAAGQVLGVRAGEGPVGGAAVPAKVPGEDHRRQIWRRSHEGPHAQGQLRVVATYWGQYFLPCLRCTLYSIVEDCQGCCGPRECRRISWHSSVWPACSSAISYAPDRQQGNKVGSKPDA